MLHMLCNKKGMGMVEVLIAFFITIIGIMALLSLQPTGWKTMAKSDYVGRASGILYKTLEDNEIFILNPCNTPTIGTGTPQLVKSSDQTSTIAGDITYTVTTTIAQDGTYANAYLVTVKVSWPPLNSTGITATIVVVQQNMFKVGC